MEYLLHCIFRLPSSVLRAPYVVCMHIMYFVPAFHPLSNPCHPPALPIARQRTRSSTETTSTALAPFVVAGEEWPVAISWTGARCQCLLLTSLSLSVSSLVCCAIAIAFSLSSLPFPGPAYLFRSMYPFPSSHIQPRPLWPLCERPCPSWFCIRRPLSISLYFPLLLS